MGGWCNAAHWRNGNRDSEGAELQRKEKGSASTSRGKNMVESSSSSSHQSSLAAPVIFIIISAFQILFKYLDDIKKNGGKSAEETQLRAEIRQLLKEASTLSQPSTFSQAAKLRRMAASKEKELVKYQESLSKEKNSLVDSYLKILFIVKVITYFFLICWFWKLHVAVISRQLVQPFGKLLSWRGGGYLNDNVLVGIVPWLVLSTRVSKLMIRLFA